MGVFRLLRITVIAVTVAVVVTASQEATLVRSGETPPGISWALGVLAAIFTASAAASARLRSASTLKTDVLWGFAAGCVVAIILRL